MAQTWVGDVGDVEVASSERLVRGESKVRWLKGWRGWRGRRDGVKRI